MDLTRPLYKIGALIAGASVSCIAAAQFNSFAGLATGSIIVSPDQFDDSIATGTGSVHFAYVDDNRYFGHAQQEMSLTLEGDAKLGLFTTTNLYTSGLTGLANGTVTASGQISGTITQSGNYQFHWSTGATNADPGSTSFGTVKSVNLKAQTTKHFTYADSQEDDYYWVGYLAAGTKIKFQTFAETQSFKGSQSLFATAGVSGKFLGSAVPEPSSVLALGVGLIWIGKRRKANR